ncbi:MAG: tape measure protein [Alkalibacterium sp.]|nr:tape measure protein [Alkalibacterium sp.]
MADKEMGGVNISISADSSQAERQMAQFFDWFTSAGAEATKLSSSIGGVMNKMSQMGQAGSSSSKNVISSYNDVQRQAQKTRDTASQIGSALKKSADRGIAGYQTLTKGVKSDNAQMSKDTQAKFSEMEGSSKKSFDEMYRDSETFNSLLKESTKASFGELGQGFRDLGNGFKSVGGNIKNVASSMGGWFKTAAGAIANAFRHPIQTMQSLGGVARDVGSKVSGFISSGFSTAKDLAISQIDKLKDGISTIAENARVAGNKAKNFFVTGFNGIVSGAGHIMSSVGNTMADLPNKAREVGTNVKDWFVRNIKGVPGESDSIWTRVKNGIKSIPEHAKSAGTTVKEKLSNGFQAVKNAAKSILPGVKNDMIESIDQPAQQSELSVMSLAKAFGLLKVAEKAINLIKSSMDGAINRLDTMNNSTRAFENMGFSANETKAAMDGLDEALKGLPTPMDEAVQGVQQISAATGDLGKSQKVFNAINDAVIGFGGSTETVNNAVMQLSQGFSKGKIQGEEWNSMLNSQMGPTLNAMAENMNMTTDELREGLSEGEISIEEFQDQLIKLDEEGGGNLKALRQVAQDATDGIKTSFGNMRIDIVKGLVDVIESFDEFVTNLTGSGIADWITEFGVKFRDALTIAGNSLQNMVEPTQNLFNVLQDLRPAIEATLGALVSYAVVTSITTKIQAMSNFLWGLSQAYRGVQISAESSSAAIAGFNLIAKANPFAILISAVTALTIGLYSLYQNSETFRNFVNEFFEQAVTMFNSLKETLTEFGVSAKEAFAPIYSAISEEAMERFAMFQGIIEKITGTFAALSAVITEGAGFTQLQETFGSVFSDETLQRILMVGEAISGFVEMAREKFAEFSEMVTQAFQGNFEPLLEFIGQLIPTIIMILVGGIPSLIYTGMNLITKLAEGMGITVPQLIEKVFGIISSMLQTFTEAMPFIIETGVNIIVKLINGIVQMLPTLIETATNLITTILEALTAALPAIIYGGISILTSLITGIMDMLPQLINTAIKLINTIVNTLVDLLPQLIKAGFKILRSLINGILDVLPELINAAVTLITSIVNTLIKNLPEIIDAGIEILFALIDGLLDVLPQLIEAAVTIILALVQGLIDNLPKIIEAGIELIVALIEGLIKAIPQIVKAIPEIVGAIKDAFMDVDWAGLGKDILDGILDGLKNIGSNVWDSVKDVGNGIKDSFMDFFDIHSPSRVMADLASNLPLGIAQGITDNADKVQQAMSAMSQLMNQQMQVPGMNVETDDRKQNNDQQEKSQFENLGNLDGSETGGNWLQTFLSGFNAGMPQVQEALNGFVQHWNETLTNNAVKQYQIGVLWLQSLLDGLKQVVPIINERTKEFISTTNRALANNNASMNKHGQTWWQLFLNGFNNVYPNIINRENAFVSQTNRTLNNNNGKMTNHGKMWLQNMLNGFNNVYPNFMNREIAFVNETNKRFNNNKPNMNAHGKNWFINFLNGFNSIYPKIMSRVRQLINEINKLISGNNGKMQSQGRTWLQRLLDGFNSLYKSFTNRVNQLGDDSVSNLRSKNGDFYDAGKYLMQRLKDGIESMQSALENTMNGIANKMTGGIGKGVNGVISGVNHVMKEVESDKRLSDWDVPSYAKGTGGHPEDGPAIVNDQKGSKYKEIFQNPGEAPMMANARNAMVYLKKGAKVWNANLSEKMLKAKNKLQSNPLPHYKKGTEDEPDMDIFDAIEDENSFSKFINGEIDLSNVFDPWKNMTKAATKLMTSEAWSFVEKEAEEFLGGSFDGDIWNNGPDAANGVYSYLIKTAKKVMKKYPGMTFTSGYRPNDPNHHGKRQAIDIAYPASDTGSQKYMAPFNYAFDKFKNTVAYVITQGKVRDRTGYSGHGSDGNLENWGSSDHDDHLHISGLFGPGDVDKGGGHDVGGSGVGRWKKTAIKALKMTGDYTKSNLSALMAQMKSESNGNPKAVNNWDSNAARGTPSKGLMQMIQPTFDSYKMKGHGNIYNALDNILAAIRYTKANYTSLTSGWRGVGYKNGGMVTKDGLYRMGEGNKNEMVLPLTKPKRAIDLIMQALQYMSNNGSSIINQAVNGINQMAMNMPSNLSGSFGNIASSFSTGGSSDLSSIVNLLEENNRLTEQNTELLAQVRDKDNNTYLNDKKMSKGLGPSMDKVQGQRRKNKERGLNN